MNNFVRIGSILGGFSVIVGAFGAHSLKNFLEETGSKETFETACKYMFYHALAICILHFLEESVWKKRALWSFLAGILFFSGSLYLICALQMKFFGAIAPIGGVFLIVGWTCMALASRSKI
ncbi:MAG: DUF423 domain-containing protein [Leadbetterella sp.]